MSDANGQLSAVHRHPGLTFAIPFYANQEYLRKAIESVLAQRSSNWRLTVCDDCGPEMGTAELVTGYRDPRISYHRNASNLGMVGNWNRGIELATTDLVTLLHADDEVEPEYTGTMLAAAERFPQATILLCQARIIDQHSMPCRSFPDLVKQFLMPSRNRDYLLRGEPSLAALLRGNFIMCPTVCYRKSLLGTRRFADGWKFAQDFELFTRLLLEGDTLAGLAAVAYRYRRHSQNATASYTDSMIRFEEESRLYRAVAAQSRRLGWRRAEDLARRMTIIKLNLGFCIVQDMRQFELKKAYRKARFLITI